MKDNINDLMKDFTGNNVVLIAGPCSLETEEQINNVAKRLKELGFKFMRAGIYKPRTSPDSFQGLGKEAIPTMEKSCKDHGLFSVSEVMDPRDVGDMAKHIDILQVGARNMQNFSLLKELGKIQNPILLKRGMSATINELLAASEYITRGGNKNVILCERGIRTFETETRNTLDISAVPVLHAKSKLPVIVDPSHATGRKDLILPMSEAAIAAGAHGIMIETHPDPANAKSDQNQQLDLDEFKTFIEYVKGFCARIGKKLI